MKRFLSVLIVFSFLITATPFVMTATAERYTEGYLTYSVNDGEAKIVKCDTDIGGIFEIPKYLGGFLVTEIGCGAFWDCTGLTKITIPNSVAGILRRAFCGCTGLTEITIPDSVTYIDCNPFCGCSGLDSIFVSENNVKYYSSGNCLIEKRTNTLISGCKNSIIPDSVTGIWEDAFSGCTGLTEITIPNSVTKIEWGAFEGCTSLTSATIPNSVTTINDLAFHDCIMLTDVYYTGTEDEWNIKNWKNSELYDFDTKVTIHYNFVPTENPTEKATEITAEKPTDKPTLSSFLGDVNQDGAIKATDARLALRAALNLQELTAEQFAAADIDKDGVVKSIDARKILRVALGLDKIVDGEYVSAQETITEMPSKQKPKPVGYEWFAEPYLTADYIIPPMNLDIDNDIHTAIDSGYYVIKQNGKYGIIDSFGTIVEPVRHKEWYYCDLCYGIDFEDLNGFDFEDGMFRTPGGHGGYDYLKFCWDNTEKKVYEYGSGSGYGDPDDILNINFDVYMGSHIVRAVSNKYGIPSFGKYGMAQNGKLTVACNFTNATELIDKYAALYDGNTWSYYEASGNLIKSGIKSIDTYKNIPYAFPFVRGVTCVNIDGKYGYMDTKGNMVVPAQFEDATPPVDNLAWVKQNGKWGIIKLTSVSQEINYSSFVGKYSVETNPGTEQNPGSGGAVNILSINGNTVEFSLSQYNGLRSEELIIYGKIDGNKIYSKYNISSQGYRGYTSLELSPDNSYIVVTSHSSGGFFDSDGFFGYDKVVMYRED
jgi:hypothetical protein